jgi:hypothetical protein
VQSKPYEPAVVQTRVVSTWQFVNVCPVKQQYWSMPPLLTGSLQVPSLDGGSDPVGQLNPEEPLVGQVIVESAWQPPAPW